MADGIHYVGKLNTLSGVRRELSRVYRALHRGEITTKDSGGRTYVLQVLGKLLETELLEARVAALESRATGAELQIESTQRLLGRAGARRGPLN